MKWFSSRTLLALAATAFLLLGVGALPSDQIGWLVMGLAVLCAISAGALHVARTRRRAAVQQPELAELLSDAFVKFEPIPKAGTPALTSAGAIFDEPHAAVLDLLRTARSSGADGGARPRGARRRFPQQLSHSVRWVDGKRPYIEVALSVQNADESVDVHIVASVYARRRCNLVLVRGFVVSTDDELDEASNAPPAPGADQDEARRDHLDRINVKTDRLATSQLTVKGVCSVPVALAAFGAAIALKAGMIALGACFADLLFWGMEAVFLRPERLYRELEEYVREQRREIPADFAAVLDPSFVRYAEAATGRSFSRRSIFWSRALVEFHGAIILVLTVSGVAVILWA